MTKPHLTDTQQRAVDAIEAANGDRTAAAEALGINGRSLRRTLAKAADNGWDPASCPPPTPSERHAAKPKRRMVPLTALITDDELQPRVKLEQRVVDTYTELYRDGGPDAMDPLRGFLLGGDDRDWVVLTRGYTRLEAAQAAGLEALPCDVFPPADQRTMLLDSLGGNKHGLQLNNADKRRALELYHASSPKKHWGTTREVAALIGCSHNRVADYRAELKGTKKAKKQAEKPAPSSDDSSEDMFNPSAAISAVFAGDIAEQSERNRDGIAAELIKANPSLHETKALILTVLFMCGDMNRQQLEQAIGRNLDVHAGQLCRTEWMAGASDSGYSLTDKGRALVEHRNDSLTDKGRALVEHRNDSLTDQLRATRIKLIDLVKAQDGEPLDLAGAAEELGISEEDIEDLAYESDQLLLTSRQVGGQPVPAIALASPRNLITELQHLVDEIEMDECRAPTVGEACARLNCDRATVLSLASTCSHLRVSTDDSDEPVVESCLPEEKTDPPAANEPAKRTAARPVNHRRQWILDQIAGPIAQARELSSRAAMLYVLHFGDLSDTGELLSGLEPGDQHSVAAAFCAAALDSLQAVAPAPANSWEEDRLLALLPGIADELNLDWPGIIAAANSRFDEAAA